MSKSSPQSSASAFPEARTALFAGTICYLIWGFIPLVFQQMSHQGADPWEIMGHRAVWGVVWATLILLLAKQGGQVLALLKQPRLMGWLCLSALLIAGNWTIYIFAVNGGKTLDASLGYYLNPLLNMAAGAWLFREKMDVAGKLAMAMAAIGVVIQTIALGHAPWVSLALALTFAGYGIIRKRIAVDAQSGLFIECLILSLPGLAWLIWLETHGGGHFTQSPMAAFWLLMAGPATVIPLVLFSWAARRMPLSTMGFLQYLAPTIVFVIGAMQGEGLSLLRLISFGFIWMAVVIFAIGAVIRSRKAAALSADPVVPSEPGLTSDPVQEQLDAKANSPR